MAKNRKKNEKKSDFKENIYIFIVLFILCAIIMLIRKFMVTFAVGLGFIAGVITAVGFGYCIVMVWLCCSNSVGDAEETFDCYVEEPMTTIEIK